ncbi:hypothetical protein DL766_010449 [Monosporascus sp. MC13-8B]|uniref:Zn(2)-C6 fungal-type domain-containing protein n=1 Tax=Monosporascus cannonballus TaxID=155416 RepID=A0ABY0GZ81_9PEZI|nr:hypothetical protein DL762_007411 [Monosporascus cannonballus]RYO84228.1 hypothetical protein DL763_007552 [Monosporascus cannonballus]RYP01803.1 hypothetical protein DL766_010449 [Monosporascus sp. MC13-8B]
MSYSRKDSLLQLSRWERICAVLGHHLQSRNRLPVPLHQIYESQARPWTDLESELAIGLTELTRSQSAYPTETDALDHIITVDGELKGWTKAWILRDQEMLHHSFFRMDEILNCLSPVRRHFSHDPAKDYDHLKPHNERQALELLMRVHHRLRDIGWDSKSGYLSPRWYAMVTRGIRHLSLKVKYMVRDILYTYAKHIPEKPIKNCSYNRPWMGNITQAILLSRPPTRTSDEGRKTKVAPSTPQDIPIYGWTAINKPELSPATSIPALAPGYDSNTPIIRWVAINTPRSSTSTINLNLIPGSGSNTPTSQRVQQEEISRRMSNVDKSTGSSGVPPAKKRKRDTNGTVNEDLTLVRRVNKKREREKAKGIKIMDNNNEGRPATNPCERCLRRGKGPCMVPKDPEVSSTFKCGRCIRDQQRCSLSARNPGSDDYDWEYRRKCIAEMDEKARKRQRREQQPSARRGCSRSSPCRYSPI